MSNISINNNDNGSVILESLSDEDGPLVFAGADTYLEGTILGRVVASGKWTPFVPAGSGGEEIPKAILTYKIVTTGAGDVQARVMTSGRVLAPRLIIQEDGDNSNITLAILDQLRDFSITAVESVELNILDNQ